MASILRVNTLTDASSNNSTAMSTINQGTAKCWARMAMSGTPSYHDSFNAGSITDNGTGDMTFTITSAMGNADFCVTSGDGNDNALDEGITTTTYRQVSRNNSGTKGDSDRVSFTCMGDLA